MRLIVVALSEMLLVLDVLYTLLCFECELSSHSLDFSSNAVI